jgi:hypothetical protein
MTVDRSQNYVQSSGAKFGMIAKERDGIFEDGLASSGSRKAKAGAQQ